MWWAHYAGGGGISDLVSAEGIAPYGLRHGSFSTKGKGYFGPIGRSTELSSEMGQGLAAIEYPLMVPTLTKDELARLLSGQDPTEAMYDKAERYARERMAQGLSPFAAPNELRYPLPED